MRGIRVLVLAALALLGLSAASAQAGIFVGVGGPVYRPYYRPVYRPYYYGGPRVVVGVGVPSVYVAPTPVYYPPSTVYVPGPTTVVTPPPVIQTAPPPQVVNPYAPPAPGR